MSLLLQSHTLPDHGHFYRETGDPSQLIMEPWNAFSSLTFWIPAIIFLWQLRGSYCNYAFIIWFCCPLLFIGGIGSGVFHAFRSSVWLILLDVVPIVILVLGVSIWMWIKVLTKKYHIAWILILFFGLTFLSFLFLEGQDRISAGYFVRGWMLLLPCYLFLRRTHFRNPGKLFAAIGVFTLALFFRYADDKIEIAFMPWGTHWLWHAFTALGAYLLGEYLIKNAFVKATS